MRTLAQLLKSLADETRLKMLVLLSEHDELCVCDFEGVLGISQSASSRHLRRLYQEGVVDHRREAVWVYYRLRDDLDEDHQGLLTAVRALVDESEHQVLRASLTAWLSQKEDQGACSV